MTDATALRRVVEEAFPALWGPTEAVLATGLALLLEDVQNPPTCILTGPPSGGKTTVLDFVADLEGLTYRSDRFTPKALVSHATNVKREALESIDLLPRLKHKVLVTPELAPMFRGRDEVLSETFSTLTRALDGDGFITDSGTQGRRGYTGDYLFAWVGGTTPLPTSVWKLMSQLGSRLFFYAMPDDEVTDAEMAAALVGERSYRDAVAACRAVVGPFLTDRFQHRGGVRGVTWDRAGDPPALLARLGDYARLVACLRGVVAVWQERDGGELGYSPQSFEGPMRAQACLYNLARGRALLCDRTRLVAADLEVVRHVALSSAPFERTALLRALVSHGGTLTTDAAARVLRASLPTARKAMKALSLLDIGDLDGEGDHAEGMTLTLAPRWRACLGLDTHTPADSFQPPEEGQACTEVESKMPVCVSATPGADEEDWS